MSPAARIALVERATDAASGLGPSVRADADALLSSCRIVFTEQALSPAERGELKRQLGSLVELLARRDARAMPLAALGRAALAELSLDTKQVAALLAECETKLSMFGF